MLDVSKPKANRLNVALYGALDSDEMRTTLDAFSQESDGISNGRILYTISDFEMPTLGAMAVERYRMPKLLGLIGKFNKSAVLCDTAWIRTAAEIAGAVIPSLAIKSFGLKDIEAAEVWLDEVSDGEEDEFENFPV
jgi:hypothetical protein